LLKFFRCKFMCQWSLAISPSVINVSQISPQDQNQFSKLLPSFYKLVYSARFLRQTEVHEKQFVELNGNMFRGTDSTKVANACKI